VPLLILAAGLVLQQRRMGDAEASIIAAGGLVMIVVQAAEVVRNVSHQQWPIDFSLAPFGFAAAIAAMNIALSMRFRRVHDELDRLRSWLSDEVRVRTEELAESRDNALAGLRTKNEFLANISHEIRTPMSGVVGIAELLALTPLTREQKEYLETIQVSGKSLLALLDDIIDFSRLDENRLTVEQRAFRVRAVVDECIATMTPLAKGKLLTLTASIDDADDPVILGDERRTRQVLLNLLGNAVKFTAAGSIEVAMRSRPLEDGRIEVRFSVADTGRGIAEEDRERLFVAFEQLDGSSRRQYGGTGLGLAISKRLAELMGGTISVESEPDRGSIFHFTIAGEPAAASEAAAVHQLASQKSLSVLLVEDDPVNRLIILDMLEQLGHRTQSATDGQAALRALERATFDVILMDVQMPGLDGFEVTQQIRTATQSRVHIIAITAHALDSDRDRCLVAGMNDYLAKPVRIGPLRAALARAT
jgi:signal transduction histidine kinase